MVDLVFKAIFGTEGREFILVDLLNSIFSKAELPLVLDVQIENPFTGVEVLSEKELVQRGLEALMNALGPVEASRFLTLPHARRLESIKRHRQWQATLDHAQFLDQVFGQGLPPNPSQSRPEIAANPA